MAKLMKGIDLGGRTLSLSIPSDTKVTGTKTIAWTDKNGEIVETYTESSDVTTGYIRLNGTNTVFYSKAGDNTPTKNLTEIAIPEGFGTIVQVDETAVMFPYIARVANEKAYLMGEDKGRVEGYSASEIDGMIGPSVKLLASGFSGQGSEKTFSVKGYHWLAVECLVSTNATYGMTAPPFVVPLVALPQNGIGHSWTVLGRNNNYMRVALFYNKSAETVRALVSAVDNGGSAINMNIFGMG